MAADRHRSITTLWLAAGIGALAITLRVIGLRYGLPAVYNPDEVAIMNRALGLAQGDLNPHNFLYPTLYFYVLFVWEGAWFVLARLAGIYESRAAFERSFFVDPSLIYVAGRFLTVVCGVATVYATWRLGERLYGRRAGTVAALLLAVAPLAVRDGHYVKHDVPVGLLIVLAHVLIAGLVLDRATSSRGWIVAGVTSGLAMSTHYYAIFVALPLAWGALMPATPGEPVAARFRRLVLTGSACIAAFFMASPFLLAEPGTAFRDIVANRQIVMDRVTVQSGMFGSLSFYLRWLAHDTAGTVTAILAVAGAAAAIAAGWRRAVVTLAFPSAFLLFIGNTYPASRYLVPVVPFVALLAGAAVARAMRYGPLAVRLSLALVVLAAVEAGAASVSADRFFRQDDTRTLAQRWIEASVPSGTSILIQPYSVPLHPSRASLVEALETHLGAVDRASIRFRRQLSLDPYPDPSYRTLFLGRGGLDVDKIYLDPSTFGGSAGLAPLRRLGVGYVVVKKFDVADPSIADLDAALGREASKVATFSPYRPEATIEQRSNVAPFIHGTDARIDPVLERPGPGLEIWRIEGAAQ